MYRIELIHQSITIFRKQGWKKADSHRQIRINFKPNANFFHQMIRHACESVEVVLRIIYAYCFAIWSAIFR